MNDLPQDMLRRIDRALLTAQGPMDQIETQAADLADAAWRVCEVGVEAVRLEMGEADFDALTKRLAAITFGVGQVARLRFTRDTLAATLSD